MSGRSHRPNIVIAFADQWRAQAAGYAGNADVSTPHLDRLADESVSFVNAVAGCPVCSPYRASLITGQHPLTHGVFVNDVCLCNGAVSIAHACKRAGYETGYVGKWHLDGHGRSTYIPPERRQGFDFWEVLECTHRYNKSPYYAGNSDEKLYWDGYDAIAQTRRACEYVEAHAGGDPFLLVLSWGPPHAPYDTAPAEYRERYNPGDVVLRPNVPASHARQARDDLAGYYAHCSALDDCLGVLRRCLDQTGIEDNTVLLFTSDHGDMLGSQGHVKKQRPWDESIRVPFLLRYPAGLT
ncbi:MAG: sulfatase family protein [Planctomycetota bacterium]|jgi:arylsulfatase A-like enzyme